MKRRPSEVTYPTWVFPLCQTSKQEPLLLSLAFLIGKKSQRNPFSYLTYTVLDYSSINITEVFSLFIFFYFIQMPVVFFVEKWEFFQISAELILVDEDNLVD